MIGCLRYESRKQAGCDQNKQKELIESPHLNVLERRIDDLVSVGQAVNLGRKQKYNFSNGM